jgi:6-phosphogluconate dehydrogenase
MPSRAAPLDGSGDSPLCVHQCIIRSVFLKDITTAYHHSVELENLLFDSFFNKAIYKAQPGWRNIVGKAALLGIPIPAFSTALSWFDG